MRDLSTGTVTFPFADVEGSTLGDADAADAWGRDSLPAFPRAGDRPNTVAVLAILDGAACLSDTPGRAGRFVGPLEAEELRGDLGGWMREPEPYAARVLACAGPELDRGREAGRVLPFDEAVRAALSLD